MRRVRHLKTSGTSAKAEDDAGEVVQALAERVRLDLVAGSERAHCVEVGERSIEGRRRSGDLPSPWGRRGIRPSCTTAGEAAPFPLCSPPPSAAGRGERALRVGENGKPTADQSYVGFG